MKVLGVESISEQTAFICPDEHNTAFDDSYQEDLHCRSEGRHRLFDTALGFPCVCVCVYVDTYSWSKLYNHYSWDLTKLAVIDRCLVYTCPRLEPYI